MATPRKNASQAEKNAISSIADFKARIGGPQELPSGLTVVVENPGGLQAFIAKGIIPNSLLKIVKDTLDTNASKDDMVEKAKAMSNDLDSIGEMMQLMDIIAVETIVKPRVYMTPTEADVEKHNILNPDNPVESPRDLVKDDQLYAHHIAEEDKMFLFQWITGGTRDLETFREQYQRNVDLVSAKQGSEDSSEFNLGANSR